MNHVHQHTVDKTLTSIFFGGGTPSLMSSRLVGDILAHAEKLWGFAPSIEITLEANPNSFEAQKFKEFRHAGVNRLSIGVQSFDEKALKYLGRAHSKEEALTALSTAEKLFEEYSFDLIYARTDQSVAAWQQELKQALPFARNHLSLYQLTIEPGTSFATQHARGTLTIPDNDQGATFYEATQDIMNAHGLPLYEVSNHARPGSESQHNLTYWRSQDYAGIGPGAHGRLRQSGETFETKTYKLPETWTKHVKAQGHGFQTWDAIEPAIRAREALMMGLRLKEPLKEDAFRAVTGVSLTDAVKHENIPMLVEEGYLIQTEESLATTLKGKLCLNAVLGALVKV